MNVEILQQKGHNFLWVDDYLWMWDIQVELDWQKKLASQCYGDVLVAGYGLGILQGHLLQNTAVTSILTIEIYPEVLEECKRVYGKIHGDVHIADFYEYEDEKKYDCVNGDVIEDILPDLLPKYECWKEKAQTFLKEDGKLVFWGGEYFEYLLEKRRDA